MIESISQILSNINNVFFPHSPDLALVVHQKVRVRLDWNFRHQLTQQKSMKSIPKCNVRRCFDFHFAHLIHMTDNLLLQNLDKHDFWICNFVMHNHHMTLLLTQRHSTVSIKQLLYNQPCPYVVLTYKGSIEYYKVDNWCMEEMAPYYHGKVLATSYSQGYYKIQLFIQLHYANP